MLHESLNGAALAGGVASFEDDDVPGARAFAPSLQLEQLDLQASLHPLAISARHPLVVGVSLAPRVDGIAITVKENGIIVVFVVDRVALFAGRK